MKIKVTPAYLGLEASQSKRSKSKDRAYSKTIWMTRDGLRLPIHEMTDFHLMSVVMLLRRQALRIKAFCKSSARIYSDLAKDAKLDAVDIWDEEDIQLNWKVEESFRETADFYKRTSKMATEKILGEMVPCWPMIVLVGYKRGLLHSNGFPEEKGWRILRGERDDE